MIDYAPHGATRLQREKDVASADEHRLECDREALEVLVEGQILFETARLDFDVPRRDLRTRTPATASGATSSDAADWKALRRKAYRPTARLIVEQAAREIDRTVSNLGHANQELQAALLPVGVKRLVADEVVSSYIDRAMGDDDLVKFAYRRLAEDLLRAALPKYSKKSGVSPDGHFATVVRPVFKAFSLTKASMQRVDGSLAKQVRHQRGLWSSLEL